MKLTCRRTEDDQTEVRVPFNEFKSHSLDSSKPTTFGKLRNINCRLVTECGHVGPTPQDWAGSLRGLLCNSIYLGGPFFDAFLSYGEASSGSVSHSFSASRVLDYR